MESPTILPPANGVAAPASFKAVPKPVRARKRKPQPRPIIGPSEPPPPIAASPAKKRGGRKPGSKNKPKAQVAPKAAPLTEKMAALPKIAIDRMFDVLALGATKYQGREWSKRPNDHVAKAMGHLATAMAGGKYDPETGLSPLAHAAARLILALQIELEKK